MRGVFLLAMVCAAMIAAPVSTADSVFRHYRGVTLGDSLEAVIAELKISAANIRTVQERPTPVQELTWRPLYQFGAGVTPDSMAEMVLTFHLNRLARIAVTYDRDRTRGMTNVDFLEALSRTYGAALLVSRPVTAIAAPPAVHETIGCWGDAETLVRLWREPFPDRLKLTITAIEADEAMQTALADGVRLEAADEPTRAHARRVVEAAAAQTQEQSARRDNKAAFKP